MRLRSYLPLASINNIVTLFHHILRLTTHCCPSSSPFSSSSSSPPQLTPPPSSHSLLPTDPSNSTHHYHHHISTIIWPSCTPLLITITLLHNHHNSPHYPLSVLLGYNKYKEITQDRTTYTWQLLRMS